MHKIIIIKTIIGKLEQCSTNWMKNYNKNVKL